MPGSPLRFTPGGDAAWVGQYPPGDLDDAFVNLPVTSDQSTWLSLEVYGPGTLTFQWRTDCDFWDDFTCKVNGNDTFDPIFGVTAWEPRTLMLYDETNIVRWVYNNTPWGNDGLGWVWVKDVVWMPSGAVLEPPAHVQASDGAFFQKTRITWDAVPSATHYEVSRADSANGVKEIVVSWAAGLTADDTGGTAGASYYYFVRAAINASGEKASNYSLPDIGFAGRRPGNDYIRDVAALAGSDVGVTQGDCTWASVQSGEPLHAGFADATNSVWWNWTATANTSVTFKVQGSVTNYQAVLAVYTNAGSVVGTLVPITSGWQDTNEWAGVTFDAVAGATYFFAVAGRDGVGSPVTLRWAVEGWQCPAPANVQATDGTLIGTVRVTWDAVADAEAYEVSRAATLGAGTSEGMPGTPTSDLRSPTSDFRPPTSEVLGKLVVSPWCTSVTFDDTAVSDGSTNYYTVRAAFDTTGWAASADSLPDTGYAQPRPANDRLANAQVLDARYGGSLPGDCLWATFEPDEPLHGGVEGATNSVWWNWTAPTNASVFFETQGSDTNVMPVLAVYTNAGSAAGTLVAITNGVSGTNGWASATFDAVAGATYLIAVAGADGAGGPLTLRWAVAGWLCPAPVNVRASDGALYETVRVTWDAVPDATHYEVWRAASLRPGSLKTRVSPWVPATFFDDTTGNRGVTYYYFVRAATDAAGWLAGPYGLSDAGSSGLRPSNDNQVSAAVLAGEAGVAAGNNALASFEPGEPEHGGFADAANSVWWRWVAPSNAVFVFTTEGSGTNFNPVLAVYTNAAGGLAPVAAAEQGANAYAQVGFVAKAGVTYLIAVAGRQALGGAVVLNWELTLPAPVNVRATDGTLFEVTRVTWDAVPGATHYEVSRALSVGGEKENLTGWTTEAEFDDWSGDLGVVYTYFVRAAADAEGWRASAYSVPDDGVTGARPVNDDRADALLVSGAAGSVQGNSTLATMEAGEPQHAGFSDAGASVWWRWAAPVSARVTFDTLGSGDFNAVLAVYTDAGGAWVPVASAERGAGDAAQVSFDAVAGVTYLLAVAGRPDAEGAVTLNWTIGAWAFPAPEGVQATAGTLAEATRVTWTPVPEAVCYEVSRAETAGGPKTVVMAWASATEFTDVSGTVGQTYSYFVRAALDTNGVLAGAYGGPAAGWSAAKPANDDQADAALLSGLSGTAAGDSTVATREPGEPQHGGFADAGASLWWRWTAPVGAPVTFATQEGVAFNAVLAVYTNAEPDVLAQVAAAERGTNLSASVTFDAQAGTTYRIALAGRPAAGGLVTLNWSFGEWTFPAPSSVQATAGTRPDVTLVTWDAVPDALYYEVARAAAGGGPTNAVMPWAAALEFADTAGTPGVAYLYYVRAALDANGVLAGAYGGPASGWLAVRPANDLRAKAFVYSNAVASVTGDSTWATAEVGEPAHGGVAGATNSVWWSWTAPSNGVARFDTQGGGLAAPVVAVYTNNGAGGVAPVAASESGTNGYAEVSFTAAKNVTYLIAMAGAEGECGPVALNLTFVPAPVIDDPTPPPPPNILGTAVRTVGGVRTLSLTFTAKQGVTYEVLTTPRLVTNAVWSSLSPAVTGVVTEALETFMLEVPMTNAAAFFKVVATAWSGGGTVEPPVPPANDKRADATVISNTVFSVTGDSTWATAEVGEPAHGGFADATNSVWWSWTAPSNGVAHFQTQSGGLAWPVVAVYTNSGTGGLVPVAASESGTNGIAQASVPVVSGVTYLIAVAGREGTGGPVTLNRTFEPEDEGELPPQPNILGAATRMADGVRMLRLTFTAKQGVTYEVLTTPRLVTNAVWSSLAPPVAGVVTEAVEVFALDVPMTNAAAFFKIEARR